MRRVISAPDPHLGARSPLAGDTGRYVADLGFECCIGTEIPGVIIARAIVAQQALSELQVTRQRHEHVLPGPYRFRITQEHRLSLRESADAVGNEPVDRPVA